ncbi:hypothetical protein BC834DRAFT_40926 [Gloeopeniophorella convolvens]|nr:hypothetical protein BC834DRAFT_40926 [Gloeopeniophorella convolvens]
MRSTLATQARIPVGEPQTRRFVLCIFLAPWQVGLTASRVQRDAGKYSSADALIRWVHPLPTGRQPQVICQVQCTVCLCSKKVYAFLILAAHCADPSITLAILPHTTSALSQGCISQHHRSQDDGVPSPSISMSASGLIKTRRLRRSLFSTRNF